MKYIPKLSIPLTLSQRNVFMCEKRSLASFWESVLDLRKDSASHSAEPFSKGWRNLLLQVLLNYNSPHSEPFIIVWD